MEKLCILFRLLVMLQMTWTLLGDGELSSVIIGDTGLAVDVTVGVVNLKQHVHVPWLSGHALGYQ